MDSICIENKPGIYVIRPLRSLTPEVPHNLTKKQCHVK